MPASGHKQTSRPHLCRVRSTPVSGREQTRCDCRLRATRRHAVVTRSWEMEHLFENCLDGLFGFTGGDRIVADVNAVNDARVRIGEWLLGVGVYEKPIGLLLDFAIAHALEFGLHRCRLRTERVVECMRGVRILRQLNIRAGGSQPLDVRLASSNWVVVILRAAEDADGLTDNIGIGQEFRHAIGVERNVGSNLYA